MPSSTRLSYPFSITSFIYSGITIGVAVAVAVDVGIGVSVDVDVGFGVIVIVGVAGIVKEQEVSKNNTITINGILFIIGLLR